MPIEFRILGDYKINYIPSDGPLNLVISTNKCGAKRQ